jgi:hypothetical protein
MVRKRVAFFWASLVCISLCADDTFTWEQAVGYRWADLRVPAQGKSGFTLLAPEQTGIRFTNLPSDALAAQNRVLQNGSGVALGDVDGDGRCDIYFCRLEGPNVLYRNLGNLRFEDATNRGRCLRRAILDRRGIRGYRQW